MVNEPKQMLIREKELKISYILYKMPKIKKLNQNYSALVAIVHVYTTFNNTLITITNISGHTILFAAAGFLGIKGARRGSSFAGQAIANILAKKLLVFGIRFLQIYLKGFGNSRKSVLKGLTTTNLKILSIKNLTLASHNGCRMKKKRRI